MQRNPNPIDRRSALAAMGALGAAGIAAASSCATRPNAAVVPGAAHGALSPQELGWDRRRAEYTLPPLPYPEDALEPYIDAQTMHIHHRRHHQGYVNGMNRALRELASIRDEQSDNALIKHWSRELSFHGSGHANHALFWITMAPPGNGGGDRPSGDLAEAIQRDFGSYEKFQTHFKLAATQVEASGWAWLVHHPASDRLMILQGEKQQDTTIWGVTPLMGVDVWEHAYYLKYQNRRGDYVDAFMNVINWPRVQELYRRARGA